MTIRREKGPDQPPFPVSVENQRPSSPPPSLSYRGPARRTARASGKQRPTVLALGILSVVLFLASAQAKVLTTGDAWGMTKQTHTVYGWELLSSPFGYVPLALLVCCAIWAITFEYTGVSVLGIPTFLPPLLMLLTCIGASLLPLAASIFSAMGQNYSEYGSGLWLWLGALWTMLMTVILAAAGAEVDAPSQDRS